MIYTKQNWSETISAMRSGQQIEIDQEVWDYFLEVLPPVGMPWKAVFADGTERTCTFGFAEGAENVVAFWRTKANREYRYFCRITTQMNPWA